MVSFWFLLNIWVMVVVLCSGMVVLVLVDRLGVIYMVMLVFRLVVRK